MKAKRVKRKKLLICGIVGISGIILMYFTLSFVAVMVPLPFVRPLWNANRYFRYSMRMDVSRRVIGLHQEDKILCQC